LPKLLEMLSLKGTIVTADALNCQRAIAQQIVDRGGDYALALKGNQGTLHDGVRLFLDDPACEATTAEPIVEADHGRIETRTAMVSSDIDWLRNDHQWAGLAAVGKAVRIREAPDKTSTETAYYLLSRALSAERFNEMVRQHRGRREPAALAARCCHERGSGQDPIGQRTPITWQFFATWRSTPCRGRRPMASRAASSSEPAGTMHSSPAFSPYFEVLGRRW
jgi:predicted transposase YbfD/YdcC